MRVRTGSGKLIHVRHVATHRILEQNWRRTLLPRFKPSFYQENSPPSSQMYLSAKHLPNADAIYRMLDASRNRHRQVIIKMSLADSLRYVWFYSTYIRRRYKNVYVQLRKGEESGIVVSWDGIAKRWKR